MIGVKLLLQNNKGVTKRQLGPYNNAGFSLIHSTGGLYGHRTSRDNLLQYSVSLEISGLEKGKSILLTTPIFDDITIFYSEGVRTASYAGLN